LSVGVSPRAKHEPVVSLPYGPTTRELRVAATDPQGQTRTFDAIVRIDTPAEAGYYRHGGILPYVLRQLLEPGEASR